MMALRVSSNKNDGAYSQPEWLRVLQGVLSFGISENHMSGYGKLDDDYNAYLDDVELLESYEEQLNSIQGQLIGYQNEADKYRGQIEDLTQQKTESEDWLEDYRQMLEGEGDDDNLLLQQDQINSANLESAEKDLAAYRDSSALELDSLITSGFSEYTEKRNDQAVVNIYASATGSVVGAFNSAARRSRNAIRAFVGDDMKFNEAAEGTSIQGRAGEGMIGSYAKSLLASRTTVKNNIAKLNTERAAAKLAFDSFRDQAADVAKENEQFLEDYDDTLSNYEKNLQAMLENISDLQASADRILANKDSVLKDVNEYEEERGWNKTTWS